MKHRHHEFAIKAVKNLLAEAEDNLYRANHVFTRSNRERKYQPPNRRFTLSEGRSQHTYQRKRGKFKPPREHGLTTPVSISSVPDGIFSLNPNENPAACEFLLRRVRNYLASGLGKSLIIDGVEGAAEAEVVRIVAEAGASWRVVFRAEDMPPTVKEL